VLQGIKFFDFTLKHHEGFSMYDTNTDVHDCWDLTGPTATIKPCCNTTGCRFPYSSVAAFGRDVAGELVTAARKGGVSPGFYFSHIDWFDPDMRIDQWNAVASSGKFCPVGTACNPANYSNATLPVEWQRFVLRHRAQIVEALTKYGEIVELSLDMQFPPIFNQAMQDTIMLARSIAPNTLFRGRGIGGTKQEGGYGDYETPEETFPSSPMPGNWLATPSPPTFLCFASFALAVGWSGWLTRFNPILLGSPGKLFSMDPTTCRTTLTRRTTSTARS
jgi:alpha-L-fucosidase